MNRSLAYLLTLILLGHFLGTRCVDATNAGFSRQTLADWVSYAERCELQGDTERALYMNQLARTHSPTSAQLHFAIGRLHYRLENYQASAESYSVAAKLAPDRADYQNNAGYSFAKAKDFEAARSHLERAVALKPKHLRFANNLAAVCVDLGDDTAAFDVLRDAHGNLASVHFNLAYLYDRRKRRLDAIREVNQALTYDSKLSRAIRLRDRLLAEPDGSD